jgi:3-deoxy-D-manno-octulosonic-acid transferase
MINLYDIAYGLAVPFWAIKPSAREKLRAALSQRMGRVPPRESAGAAVLIHAVSLGEINATASLVNLLQQSRPDLHVIVSTTTQTGFDRGLQLYGANLNVTLVRYPLDFTAAINRLLDALRPSLVVLMELELWPNFLRQCDNRKIPVLLINGRMTPSAFKRYKLARPIIAPMFRRLAMICAQDQTYADRFQQLGAPVDRICITGTMKFDTAEIADCVDGDAQLANEVGLKPGEEPILVCGSTGPGEEKIILDAYRLLLLKSPALRLVIVPRKPERFNEVAETIQKADFPLRRRTDGPLSAGIQPVILGDTMGELRKFYSLATIVFVGRSLLDLGSRQNGSDMIEPAALARPIIVGPWTQNFAEAMRKLKEADAITEVSNTALLAAKIQSWLTSPVDAAAMGRRAQSVVQQNQGATAKHAQIILDHLKV